MDGRRAEKRRYGILLAIVAASILIVGLLLKPREIVRPTTQDARVDAVRADLNSLRELAQRNTLRTTSNRFSAMAAADAAFLLESNQSKTAIVWSDDGLVLASGRPLAGGLQVAADGTHFAATPSTWGAGLPFTLYRTKDSSSSPPGTTKMHDLQPGTWTIVDSVGTQGPEFVSGMYSGTGKTTCDGVDYNKILLNAPFDPRFLGSGMFDIDGNLIAVLAQCDHEVAAIPVEEIDQHLTDLSRPEQAPFAHFGFVVQPITAATGSLLSVSSGLVVTDVWTNWPAGLAGIVPGDVLLAVNNVPASSVEQVAHALRNAPVQLTIQHALHLTVSISLDADSAPAPIAVQTPDQGVVLSDGSGASTMPSGLRPGDRIVTAAGRPATAKAVLQLLSSPASPPSLLTVQRGTRQFLVKVPG